MTKSDIENSPNPWLHIVFHAHGDRGFEKAGWEKEGVSCWVLENQKGMNLEFHLANGEVIREWTAVYFYDRLTQIGYLEYRQIRSQEFTIDQDWYLAHHSIVAIKTADIEHDCPEGQP